MRCSSDEGGELRNLPSHGVDREPVLGEHLAELRVDGHRGMTDAVDRLDHVPHPDGVKTSPLTFRPHPRVDLQVEMPVGVPRPGRVMPDDGCLNLLDRHLHLPATRPDPRRRVLGHERDDLLGRAILSGVQRRRHLRVQRRCQRPRLRPVDRNLDVPQRVAVLP